MLFATTIATLLAVFLALCATATPIPPVTADRAPGINVRVHPNGDTKFCLDAAQGIPTPDPGYMSQKTTPVQIWECNDNPQQIWTLSRLNGTTRIYTSYESSRGCISSSGNTGSRIVIAECRNRAFLYQMFTVVDGTIRRAINPQGCLDVPNGDHENGNFVRAWGCEGNTNQQWTFVPV